MLELALHGTRKNFRRTAFNFREMRENVHTHGLDSRCTLHAHLPLEHIAPIFGRSTQQNADTPRMKKPESAELRIRIPADAFLFPAVSDLRRR